MRAVDSAVNMGSSLKTLRVKHSTVVMAPSLAVKLITFVELPKV